MRKIIVLFGLLLFSILNCFCQENLKYFNEEFNSIKKDSNRIVSDKTINDIALKNFNKIQTGTKIINTTGKFATLDINKESKRFSFSPFTCQNSLGFQFGLVISGELNSKNNFDFKDRNQLGLGINLTKYYSKSSFKNKPSAIFYKNMYLKIEEKLNNQKGKTKIEDLLIENDSLRNEKENNLLNKLKNEYLIKYETALAEKYWTSKMFWWWTINLKPINRDNFYYIVEDDLESYDKPYNKSINVFSLSGSINVFYENSNIIVNPSISIDISNKHNLSEIYSTSKWNNYTVLNPNSNLSNSSKDVYVLKDNNFHQLILADLYLKTILVYKKWNLGLDLNFDNIKFIKPTTTNSVSKINNFNIGLILPFKDAKGETSINIVPFFEYKQFIDFDKSKENNYGIKFNIPFN